MFIIIDNYDSFTYNLVQYFGELGIDPVVYRNDKISVEKLLKMKPDKLVISPGPCTPNEAGISNDAIRSFAGKIPILGVCLGHQCIGQVFGGVVKKAKHIMHGKLSKIKHNNKNIFRGMPQNFEATRYHSLVIEKESLPSCLAITAQTYDNDKEIMGIRHRTKPIYGVQFHPESIKTDYGKQILRNFLSL